MKQMSFNCLPDVLRRLDDKEDTVRALCLDIVSAVPRCISSEDVGLPETQAFVEHASKMILLHADDSDEDIRKKCIGTIFCSLLCAKWGLTCLPLPKGNFQSKKSLEVL